MQFKDKTHTEEAKDYCHVSGIQEIGYCHKGNDYIDDEEKSNPWMHCITSVSGIGIAGQLHQGPEQPHPDQPVDGPGFDSHGNSLHIL